MPPITDGAASGAESGVGIGLEAKLWASADALRNNMDAAECKHVVLGLIFLKYISDAFESKHAELEAQTAQGADPEDPDEGTVELRLKDGRELRHHTAAVRGTNENPMSRAEVEEKCFNLMAPVLGQRRARIVCDTVWRLEGVKSSRSPGWSGSAIAGRTGIRHPRSCPATSRLGSRSTPSTAHRPRALRPR